MLRILLILFLFGSFNANSQVGSLYINEFLASNKTINIPGHAPKDDWIEIINTSGSAIDISGYYITDNLNNLKKVQFPSTPGSLVVPANGYLLIICSDNPNLGPQHINLGLSASGEALALTAPDGTTLIDSFTFGPQQDDISMGRNPSNINEWKYFPNPTPGTANNPQGMYSETLSAPSFSHSAGFYTTDFNLTISTPTSGATIYYTLDGSDPDPQNIAGNTFSYKQYPGGPSFTETMNTYVYSAAIPISNRSGQPNKVSVKSTSPIDNNSYFPNGLVSKATVVKALAYKDGTKSEIATHTYFVFPTTEKYTLPVVSISLDEKKLFDFETGLYTWGVNYDPANPCSKGNYYEGWRYTGHFEYFVDKNKVIDRALEYRMNGGCTRMVPRKTFRVLGGSALNYPLFNNTPERNHRNILIRNGGQNWDSNFMKDAINQDIVSSMKFGKQEATPAVVFLNGEYWGIQNLRERIDQHYLSTLYGVDKDNVDLIEVAGFAEASEGDLVAYNNLLSFVGNNSFTTDAKYDSLANLIDIESFIDYHIAQTYLANYDWPTNNTRLWRAKTAFDPSVKGPSDGRWRWILYDTDMMSYSFVDRLNWLPTQTHSNTLVFRKLNENQKFKRQLVSRYADLLNTLFLSTRTSAIIDDYKNRLQGGIQEHIDRWKSPSLSTWNSEINSQRNFFIERPAYTRGFLKSYLGLNYEKNLTVDVSNENQGYIQVNTIAILPTTPGVSAHPYPWTGVYFQDLPVTLIAHPKKGGKFKHWLKNGVYYANTSSITINLMANDTFKAIFEENILSENPFPIAKTLDECGFQFTEWSANAPSGSHPENMAFVYFSPTVPRSEPDHILSDTLAGFTSGKFDHTNRSRVNGLGQDGVSFINTGGDAEHPGYPFGKLGGLLLALNTLGQDSVYLTFTAGTVAPNERDYAIRLQYRIGDVEEFKDVLDKNNQPIEYIRNPVAGHFMVFDKIKLPDEIGNQPYVQLLWNYYHKGNINSGSRAQIRLDDIKVSTKSRYTQGTQQNGLTSNFSIIESKATIKQGAISQYSATEYILLEPGFNTEPQTAFKAEIKTCH